MNLRFLRICRAVVALAIAAVVITAAAVGITGWAAILTDVVVVAIFASAMWAQTRAIRRITEADRRRPD